MPNFMETVEAVESEAADIRTLFEGDRRVRGSAHGANYNQRLTEAARLIAAVSKGKKPLWHLREAMSTSDFPSLFADVLDRQLLPAYQAIEPTWRTYIRRSTVPDFRDAKRFAVDGAEAPLGPVGELEEYPGAALGEAFDTLAVSKYGRRVDISWETLVNDDLDALRDLPNKLARAARRTEEVLATGLYVGSAGPDGTLFGAHGTQTNVIPGNPELSIEGLQAAYAHIGTITDDEGNPVNIGPAVLVVPPALEVIANNIINATEITLKGAGGTDDQRLTAKNWMANRLTVVVNPYIGTLANTNGATSWFLFAAPNGGRTALELGFLTGYEEPGLFEKVPDSRRVGGGEATESFDTDSRTWKVRHVLGGARLLNTGGWRFAYASNGTGS